MWCDPARCAANPAVLGRDGDGIGDAGEHRSAPVPLTLAGAFSLPAREGSAWLSQACAPWPCAPYLLVTVGDAELSMPTDDAGPETSAVRHEQQVLVRRAVAALPAQQQALLGLLVASPAPSYAQISARLGMPVGSIGPTRGRCLAKLRLALAADPQWGAA